MSDNGMIFEKERNNDRINDDGTHAAGSALVWPRHSCSAARKSSIGSSSGQKSPCNTATSVIGPLPCCAISSSLHLIRYSKRMLLPLLLIAAAPDWIPA